MDLTSETHHYGSHERQKVTVHRRDAAGSHPCGPPEISPGLLTIHGGYWTKRSGMGDWPRRFAAEDGYVVVDVDYRLAGDAPWPAQREDVVAALRWIQGNAARYGLAPGRIAALGSSAGGHLAAMLALTTALTPATQPSHLPLAAVVALSAPLTPSLAWRDGASPVGAWAAKKRRLRDAAEQLTACAHPDESACGSVWKDVDVLTHVSGAADPPMLMGHFTEDLVPVKHSGRLREAELEVGMPSSKITVLEIAGTAHGMSLMKLAGFAAAARAFLQAWTRLTQVPPPAGHRSPPAVPPDSHAAAKAVLWPPRVWP